MNNEQYETTIDKMARDICHLSCSCEDCMMNVNRMNMTKQQYCKARQYAVRAYEKGYRHVPCKIGDTVFVINRHLNRVFECVVIRVCVGNDSDNRNYIRTRWTGSKGNESIRKWAFRQIGNYVFFSKEEEAETALSEGANNE